ncbi:hypothetical protein GH714_005429 [Hevea brasiliensis]|uniref:Molybdopterin oxidoreductase domain-containing protein n=1 Tax=Hevea brasiliensis TaxID=3981 RepID=A0A6A6M868_HEVBR|nr:hypothetical protein GH714_005429 [Hevea brasiliensis]
MIHGAYGLFKAVSWCDALAVVPEPRVEAAMVDARIRKTIHATNAKRPDKDAIFTTVEAFVKKGNIVRPDWNGFNVLLLNVAQAAAFDLGLVLKSSKSIESTKFVYLIGADDVNLDKPSKDAIVVYQGHHGDHGVYHAIVILPEAAFTEKKRTCKNTK